FARQVGQTLYAVRALPLGGMCRLAGMDDSELAEEQADPDDPASFVNRPFWQRILIVAAGPLMNFVLAVAILTGLFSAYGVPMATVVDVVDASPAEVAGFRAGDTIVSVNGRPVASVAGFVNTISASWGRRMDVEVQRDGQRETLYVVPDYDAQVRVGRIGVRLTESPVRAETRGTVGGALRYTWGVVDTTVTSLWAVLSGRTKPEVSGPLGIAGMSAQAAQQGLPSLMMFIALISTSLGLLNLMPVPILDGGWILLLALEAVRGRPLSPQIEEALKFVGLALLMLLMVYATVSDISRLVVR
ncbi:MAG TPA: RIP metalloprotease RseP, partial [Firmicutes bacterium]|nr:RIP metalloprotease RseP [Bacillota bacterium]